MQELHLTTFKTKIKKRQGLNAKNFIPHVGMNAAGELSSVVRAIIVIAPGIVVLFLTRPPKSGLNFSNKS